MRFSAVVLFLILFFSGSLIVMGQKFHLTSAKCYNPRETASINLFMDWTAFNETEMFCYDNLGHGHAEGQTYVSCGGCMVYSCMSRPCLERDGSLFKMYWELMEISINCCQDCEGTVIPPNKAVSHKEVRGDQGCLLREHGVCQTNSGGAYIKVSFDSKNCCMDDFGWVRVGFTRMEPTTCSVRECVEGRPAQWGRHTEYRGGCNCCELDNNLIGPGNCVIVQGQGKVCCCAGKMVQNVELNDTTANFETTLTVLETTTRMPLFKTTTLKETPSTNTDIFTTGIAPKHSSTTPFVEQNPTTRTTLSTEAFTAATSTTTTTTKSVKTTSITTVTTSYFTTMTTFPNINPPKITLPPLPEEIISAK